MSQVAPMTAVLSLSHEPYSVMNSDLRRTVKQRVEQSDGVRLVQPGS
jgi:hypothetical protein